MKVAMLPRSSRWRANPYLDMLEAGLKAHGIETISDFHDELSWLWLLRSRSEVGVIHLHWLHYHYERETERLSRWALIRFISKLMLAKALGYHLVWTVHNLHPHESRFPKLDRACWQAVARLVHQIIVHCREVGYQLELRFGRRRHVHVLPHPNYVQFCSDLPSQQEARRQLGLGTASPIFLCFGIVRAYKGFQDAASTFTMLSGENARLIIVGRPVDEQIAREIRELTRADNRIMAVLEHVPDEDLPIYLASADVVVLPFRRIVTSGSAILAMSLGRPVIAPAIGCLPELVTEDAGILYAPNDEEALLHAMRRCWELDLESMGRRAYQRVTEFTPKEVARRHLAVYAKN
jgi:beta-1,4-mannosyltransferase